MKFTPENVTKLEPNQIFVFGANCAGIHGAGAAKQALKFGAKHRHFGWVGQTYTLMTKDSNLQTLSLSDIKEEIDFFLEIVRDNPKKEWLLTKIGCGLAGYSVPEIAKLFIDFLPLPNNLIVPKDFYTYWAEEDLEIYCLHTDEKVEKSGLTETTGVVVCQKCGNKREWNAY